MSGSLPTLAAIGLYSVIGVVVAALLAARGQPSATAVAAVVVWPFLLPLLVRPEARPPGGPCAERIDRVFDGLLQTLEDPASEEVPWAEQALELRAALHKADARLAFVDRVLADASESEAAEGTARSLREARAHAAAEIDAVLTAVAQLRLQVGLLALVGDTHPVQARLESLVARANALLEVHEAGYVPATA